LSIILLFHCLMGHTHIGRTLENFWQKIFFPKYFFSKWFFSNVDFSKKILLFHCFMCHTQKKKFFPTFCFFSKKNDFWKEIFFWATPWYTLPQKIFEKNFFFQFLFFCKKKFLLKKSFFLGHTRIDLTFFLFFFRRVVTHVPNANSRSSLRVTALVFQHFCFSKKN